MTDDQLDKWPMSDHKEVLMDITDIGCLWPAVGEWRGYTEDIIRPLTEKPHDWRISEKNGMNAAKLIGN